MAKRGGRRTDGSGTDSGGGKGQEADKMVDM